MQLHIHVTCIKYEIIINNIIINMLSIQKVRNLSKIKIHTPQ